ncbi:class D beta-lactamase [Pseudomonas lalucatii]|uniref:Beta-lactamase n=1 Tax=Pseudomonas lalucatii TaxID=1424203 RepID=A0ABS5Q2V8_9PSED|nr:class D beta-lactamase [Pseudomonas lalucatii]MBS7662671.1 class D beta-lactamase [Pseudomonas lalucatii]MBS7725771.1 class D beta-lactamase [Pseudomonas lalucatii]
MQRMLCGVLLVLVGHAQALDWQDSPAVSRAFAQAGATGTFVLHEVGSDRLQGHNRRRAATRYSPASTFKIANSLIGLATGAVASVDEVFPYDGQPQFLKSWERDMGLREAIRVSNLSAYQMLARRIGLPRMRRQVAALVYGNGEVGTAVDRFWLDGPLAISAVEQAEFLARLSQDRLPLAPAIQAKVREISLLEQGPGWRLYGKTGWATSVEPAIGWWVGWLEQDGKGYSFALNMDIHGPAELPRRMALGKASLRALGLL